MRRDKSEQALRLECLKIAANVVCQLKNERISVVDLAATYIKFLHAADDADDADNAEEDAADRPVFPTSAHRGRYSLKDLRRRP